MKGEFINMENTKQRNPWLVFIFVMIACIAVAADLFKVPPVMMPLMISLGATEAVAPWFMTISSVIGIVLALPAGGIMMKTGSKLLALIGIGFALLGSLIGTFSPNYIMLLVTRFIEGVGMGLMSVAAPSIISALFPPEKRGLPMSIWSCWVTIGILMIFNIANVFLPAGVPLPMLSQDQAHFAWTSVWWFMSAFLAVGGVLFALFVKVPAMQEEHPAADGGPKPSLGTVLKSIPTWCLAILFMLFATGFGMVTTFYPTYLPAALGMDPQYANFLTGTVMMVTMLVAGVIIGVLLNVLAKHRTILLVVICVLSAVGYVLVLSLTENFVLPFMFIGGLIFQLMPAAVFTVAPETAPSPATIGLTMGIVVIGQNIGGVGPGIVGSIIARTGNDAFANVGFYDWNLGRIILIVFAVITVLVGLVYWWSRNKMDKERAAAAKAE